METITIEFMTDEPGPDGWYIYEFTLPKCERIVVERIKDDYGMQDHRGVRGFTADGKQVNIICMRKFSATLGG
jgi:hypothetical protein